ncbi:hypothetical protein I4U23_007197 [Adineta vaga]|nr:hypothetical protein I4U23_007197 [Adineta vaga]
MRACLAAKRPIIISMILVPDANTEAKRNNGYITKPNISSYALEGTIDNFHTVLIVGYDDETKHFHVQNSYGRDWGQDGCFYIPYKYVLDQNLVPTGNDIWAIGDVVSRAEQSPPMWQLVTP